MKTILICLCAFLATASNVALADDIGQQREQTFAHLSVSHDWDGPPRCNPGSGGQGSAWSPQSGWAIVSERVAINSENNSRITLQRRAGGPGFPNVGDVNNQFELLATLARVTKNEEAAKEISALRDRWIRARENDTQDNSLYAEVWAGAHGNCFDRKRGWADATFYATTRYVGDSQALADEVARLRNKYFSGL